jgi:uncharacterized protein (TIGR03000 family)
VTVQVPADALVHLEGRKAQAVGTVRRFSTSALTRGEKWNDYQIVVTLDRNGRQLKQEKSIDLVGGQSYDLRFDFADNLRVALR